MKKYPDPIRYKPINPSKYVGNLNEITMRSSWESHLAFWFDTHPSVLKWGSEIKAIPYYSRVDMRVRRYFPDFWAIIKQSDGSEKKYIIEVKQNAQTKPPKKGKNKEVYIEAMKTWIVNQDKWKAATEFAQKNGFNFMIMDEYTLGLSRK